MKKIGPAMCVEYVDANNRRFVISFTASRIDHQIYLAISHYEALIEGFLRHLSLSLSLSLSFLVKIHSYINKCV